MEISLHASVLEFICCTFALWLCSQAANTHTNDLKTAAIYSAINQILIVIILGGGILISTSSVISGKIFFIFFLITFVVSFFLLKKMYGTSILSTLWLVLACWAVRAGADKLVKTIF
jgi:hypothetical protein